MKKLLPLLAAFALLFACKKSVSETPSAFTPHPAPAWKITALDGRVLGSGELAGKVVLVNFWATWCPPCNAEIPGLIDLQKRHGSEGLVIVGISVDQDGPEKVRQFIASKNINYPIAMADPAISSNFGEFEGIPASFVIDRKGVIQTMHIGYASTETLEKWVSPLLNAK